MSILVSVFEATSRKVGPFSSCSALDSPSTSTISASSMSSSPGGKKSREKKIEQMIEALVLDKLETEVHRRYQEGRKQIIKARRRTRRAEEKAKEEAEPQAKEEKRADEKPATASEPPKAKAERKKQPEAKDKHKPES